MATGAIRLVVGASDYLAQAGILRALDSAENVSVVAMCSSIEALRTAVATHEPDVVLTTLRLPPGYTDEGVTFAAELRHSRPKIGVVVLGEQADSELALQLFEGRISQRAYLL